MIAVIGRPVELVITVSFMDGVLGPIPAGIDECKRLAHEIAVHKDGSTNLPGLREVAAFAASTGRVPDNQRAESWLVVAHAP